MVVIKPFWKNTVLLFKSRFSSPALHVTGGKIVRSAFLIGLLMIYSITTIGITVHFHYCMDRFAGWSLVDLSDKQCPKCDMRDHKEGCCNDVQKHIKLSEDYQKMTFSLKNVLIDFGPSVSVISDETPYAFSASGLFRSSFHPPPLDKLRLHLQYCVFLI